MGQDSKEIYNAQSKGVLLYFDPDDLVIVEDDPKHPLYDEDSNAYQVPESLVRNIMVHGVKNPVLIRKNGERPDGRPRVEVIDGRSRVKAARLANDRLRAEGSEPLRVPGVPIKGSTEDGDVAGIMAMSNHHRRGLGPLARARQVQKLLDHGKSPTECSVILGVSTMTISHCKALLQCSAKVQQAIEQGQFSADAAVELSQMAKTDQDAALTALLAQGPVRGKTGRKAAKEAAAGKAPREQRAKLPLATIRKLHEALEPSKDEPLDDTEKIVRAVLAFVMGDMSALQPYKQVQKIARKVLA